MYRNPNDSEWLASPVSSSRDYAVCYVSGTGYLDDNVGWDYSYGVAPLVSLKSGVDLTN